MESGQWALNSWQWTMGRGRVSPVPDFNFAKFRFLEVWRFYEILISWNFSQIFAKNEIWNFTKFRFTKFRWPPYYKFATFFRYWISLENVSPLSEIISDWLLLINIWMVRYREHSLISEWAENSGLRAQLQSFFDDDRSPWSSLSSSLITKEETIAS